MEPLRITIFLRTPVVEAEAARNLDSLLAWCMVEEARTKGPEPDYDAIHEALPLERAEGEGGWVWKASQLIEGGRYQTNARWLSRKFWSEGYAEMYESGRMIVSGQKGLGVPTDRLTAVPSDKPRRDGKYMVQTGAKAGQIDTSRNHTKNAGFFYSVAGMHRLTAFAVGDRERIEHLLNTYATHVGKRRRLGHGEVRHIQVERDPSGAILWSQRVMPWKIHETDIPCESPLRPPYWRRERAVAAWKPRDLTEVAG